jgi:hypothetical protein
MPMTRKRYSGVMALNDCLIMVVKRTFGAPVAVAMACSPHLAGPRGGRPRIPRGIGKSVTAVANDMQVGLCCMKVVVLVAVILQVGLVCARVDVSVGRRSASSRSAAMCMSCRSHARVLTDS